MFVGGSQFAHLRGRRLGLGGGSQTFGFFASVNGSKSDRFLDPVNFDNLHNHGDTDRGFLRLDTPRPIQKTRSASPRSSGETHRDVPNTFTQEAAGQDQRVRSDDQNFNLGWQRIVSQTSVLDAGRLRPLLEVQARRSPDDTPVTATSNRSLDNYGVSPASTGPTRTRGQGRRASSSAIPIKESFSFGITDPGLNDPAVADDYNPNLAPYDLTRGGTSLQLQRQPHGHLLRRLRAGQRQVRQLDREPRPPLRPQRPAGRASRSSSRGSGLAYYIPSTKTVFRASYNRVLYTPEYENILFSSSAEAAALAPPAVKDSRALGGGVLLVHSERQNAYHRRRTAGARLEAPPRRRLLAAQSTVRRRPGPVLEHRHRLSARVHKRAVSTAGTCGSISPRRPASAASSRSATRMRSTSRRSPVGCSSTRARSTRSPAVRSSSTTTRSCRLRAR